MKLQLEAILNNLTSALQNVNTQGDIEKLRVKYLGKKGELTAILKQMGKLSPEERPIMGQLANEVRAKIEKSIEEKSAKIKEQELKTKLAIEKIDVTLPGKQQKIGHKHPISIVLDEIQQIFIGMGFDIVYGPEVEYDYYNFEALNSLKTTHQEILKIRSM